MIKGAIFDLDHTLFDRHGTLAAIAEKFCGHFDMAVDLDKAVEMMIEADKKYNHSGWENMHRYLIEKGFFRTAPTFEEYREALLEEFKYVAVEFPFTKPMLDELHAMGLKTGLITNGRSKVQRAKIAQLGLEDYLDEIIVSGEFGIEKPDPAPYLAMAGKLGLKPEELIYVGDNPSTDILGARAAGYTPVWVSTMGWWTFPEIEETKYKVTDVSEIPALVRELNSKGE